jgi:predicted RNA binding protein YcfA (HicA-like mRNA interferase family)
MNGREVIKRLETAGWWVVRIRGSHHQMTNGRKKTTVAVHGSRDLIIDTLKGIERQTGVKLK